MMGSMTPSISRWKAAVLRIPALLTSQIYRKFKTGVKILKIEKVIAFDKYLHELFFAFYFHLSKIYFLR